MYLQYNKKKASYLPHLSPLPKDFSEQVNHTYVFLPHWEGGPNISITILYDHIRRAFRSMAHSRPKTLVLQVDNCAKEGKNKVMFAFAAHLVHFGWFKKVKIVSLIQGHTHDLIDQLFATWSIAERKQCIQSLCALSDFLARAY